MSNWSGGYVTDVDYIAGFYAEQSPHLLAAACLVSGIAVDVDLAAPGCHFLELGCGRGRNAMAAAAGNPHWRVTAIDFNPAAIAEARTIAAECGLDNVTFIEADLASFHSSPEAAALPPVDVVSMHGVWSWVPPAVRDGIVRLLDGKLRAGGLVHVSYNVLPGLQGALGMQRLLRGAGQVLARTSDQQAVAGLAVVRELVAAEAMHVADPKVVTELLSTLSDVPVAYLAHEYMNATWAPCFHGDVADALAPARLDYACSPRIAENFPALMMTEAQRAIHDRFDDPRLRELIKDMCAPRGLRHDIYVRGLRRLTPTAQSRALRALWIATTVPAAKFIYRIDMPAGTATLGEAFYGPVVRALAAGPARVGDLLQLPELEGRRDNPAELTGMLLGTLQAAVVPSPQAGPEPRQMAFNSGIARHSVQLDQLGRAAVAASTRLGGGMACRAVELFLIERINATGGGIDPGIWATELGPDLPEEEHARLRSLLITVLEERLPVWRGAGLV
jgi:SAM-dependent methyltransferase